MDNKTAFWLALIIVCILASDIFYFEWDILLFLGQQVARASSWLAFWRKL